MLSLRFMFHVLAAARAWHSGCSVMSMRPDELNYTIKPQPLDRGHPQPPPAKERGVSQQPVPPPDGPLVGDVSMHDDDFDVDLDAGGTRIFLWIAIIVIVFAVLVWAVVKGVVL